MIVVLVNGDDFGYIRGFDGVIDEAVVFDRSLSDAEAADLASDIDANGIADFWDPASVTPTPTLGPSPTPAPGPSPMPVVGNYTLEFDGEDDYVSCGTAVGNSLSAITLSAWVKPSTTHSR